MAATTTTTPKTATIPVFFLKTRSEPSDAYEQLFTDALSGNGSGFEPVFVPVLEHRFVDEGVTQLKNLLVKQAIQSNSRGGPDSSYGGIIFTSQRAVEGFAQAVQQVKTSSFEGVPIYSVGPATTRALRAIPRPSPLEVYGDHTGNGEDLAYFIEKHYRSIQDQTTGLRPLLFVVGEKRRDIIPKVLMAGGARANSIQVDELVVYETGEMKSFSRDFDDALATTKDRQMRWAVVFSPTGCNNMLACLGLLDPETGKARKGSNDSDTNEPLTYVATIGPTTRGYLRKTFGFEPHVCADEPSPEGILRGIKQFMEARTNP